MEGFEGSTKSYIYNLYNYLRYSQTTTSSDSIYAFTLERLVVYHNRFVHDSVLIHLDTTFISEGNETYIDGLVNFEKMVITHHCCMAIVFI